MSVNPKKTLHFIGIGGIGMSGIAEVFLNQGYPVTGSDLNETEITKRLRDLGAKIFISHDGSNVIGTDVVVISSAVRNDNPEVVEAKLRRIPVIPRAEMLGELMRGKVGIAVAGTHGKTTTTSLIASILTHCHLDPTAVIGGKVNAYGSNSKLGKGRFVVAEADESDGSFLHLPATYATITNIDNDHLDFFGSQEKIDQAFIDLVGQIPFYGRVAVCGEDLGVQRCLASFTKPYSTYGLSDQFDCYAKDISSSGIGSKFKVFYRGQLLGEATLPIPGSHNVLNALAATVICLEIGLDFQQISSGLSSFGGFKRRFEIRLHDQENNRYVVDDYGHHPTEIAATLAAARGFWSGRIISVFQPHRFTRTLTSIEGFKNCFRKSDVVLLTDIYPAGEVPIPGINSSWLRDQIHSAAYGSQVITFTGSLNTTELQLQELFAPNDLIICFGAGSIVQLSDQLVSKLSKNAQ